MFGMAELSAQPTSIQSIYSWHTENRLYVNRRYQRKLVWTLIEKQKLIESILKKYPIPAVLIAEREEEPGSYEIIDGLQRLHAIISFIETGFPTLEGQYFNLEYFPTAKSRASTGVFEAAQSSEQLPQKQVSTLLDYALALSVMRNATEDEVNDVFGRINTYGHRLSDQERRQAGVESALSEMVRNIACTLRGDVSTDLLLLSSMPQISIDLPMAKHGYTVKAEEVFWVTEGILRSTDLRDSMDEQCIADIAVCIVTGKLIERSKDALDDVYDRSTSASIEVDTSLEVYGAENFASEFKYCVDEILKVCRSGGGMITHLRDLLFKRGNTNAFPSVFATVMIAFHELIVKEKNVITDYPGVQKSLVDLNSRIETGRKATSPDERRKNIDVVKGLIKGCFILGDPGPTIYGNHASLDVDAIIRRSEVEVSAYELKQGLLTLSDQRIQDSNLIDKVIKTICAIANNGPLHAGKLIIGVTDKETDSLRIATLDGITPKKVGKRFVVGVAREARFLNITPDAYFGKWKNALKDSVLSSPLKETVLSNMDFNDYYGMGVIIVTIPPQKQLSYVGDDVYWREGDSTSLAKTAKVIASLAQRFGTAS
jgi:hypothetical protein